jgi:hypothetical protein
MLRVQVKSASEMRRTKLANVWVRSLWNEVQGDRFMSRGTQSVGIAGSRRRAAGLVVSIVALIFLGTVNPAMAQDGGNQAGLVIQFGDGSVHTACVDLGSDGQATGEEVLRAAGFETRIDFSSGFGGGTVCKIGNEGCNFPADKCFCQCTMKPGDPCVYWSYFHSLEGQWRYSSQGLDSYLVRAGDVEGWVWGLSTVGGGILPPLISFEEICDAPSGAPPPSPTAESPQPTATQPPQPTPTATVGQPTGTTRPTDTPVATASPAPTTRPSPTRTPVSETATRSPRPAVVATSTLPPPATSVVAPTETAVPTATQRSTPEAVASGTERDEMQAAETETPAPTPTVKGVENGSSATGYIVFGVLAVGLVAGLIVLRVRQRQ